MKTTKNIKMAISKYNREEKYSLEKAISIVKEMKFSKFDESVDIAINLNVNPKTCRRKYKSQCCTTSRYWQRC